MRSYLYLAVAAASAVAMALAVTPADAATGHVLTIGKTGGTAVKTDAVLKSGLASGKDVVFTTKSEKLSCTSAGFSAKVTDNPTKPGKAAESLTSQSFAKCTVNVAGVTVTSVKAGNLPYKVTVSDSAGDPVTVSGQSKSKPLEFTATVSVTGVGTVTCTDSAASITGHASNTGNEITFTNQKFSYKGSNPFCTAGSFSATFGPVTDSSVTGSPKVFVN